MRVVVLGGNHQNPLGVIRALGERGIRPDVIINASCRSSFVLKSKYVNRGWICPTDGDVLDCLMSNFHYSADKAVVIACSDNMASLLSNNYERLSPLFHLPVMEGQGALGQWVDKAYMDHVACRMGFNVPKSWIVNKKEIPDDIIFPCVTKSLTSVGYGKSEFARCDTKEELQEFMRNHIHSEEILVQQFVESDFEFQYLGCSLGSGEEIIIPGRTHITDARHFNNLTFLKYQEDKAVGKKNLLPMIKNFIKETHYSGLFSFEFMHGTDGKVYFLEMNFRNDGNALAVVASGTNLPYIWCLYCLGKDWRREIGMSVVRETYAMPEDSCFMAMLDGEVSYATWRGYLKKTTCFLTFDRHDLRPFVSLLWLQKKPLAASVVYFVLRKLGLKR